MYSPVMSVGLISLSVINDPNVQKNSVPSKDSHDTNYFTSLRPVFHSCVYNSYPKPRKNTLNTHLSVAKHLVLITAMLLMWH